MLFQLFSVWIILLPMLIGSALVNVALFIAFFLAALGLFAMHACKTLCPKCKEA